MEVTCTVCGRIFEHNRKVMYCSNRCKNIASKQRRGIGTYAISIPIQKQCVICGKTFETVRADLITCGAPECVEERERRSHRERDRRRGRDPRAKHTREEWNAIKHREAEQRQITKKVEKAWLKALHTVERECAQCGKPFYCLDTETKQTCSSECSRKYKNRKRDHRIPKEQYVDHITLERLYRRDNGKCYICGCDCDFDDYKISRRGNKYPGDKRPEIEHVIPISRGGLHSWGNVRLACHRCNHKKSDSLIIVEPLSKEIAYSMQPKPNAKQTAQYTLDGQLIKVWESTGQIERELGLSSKHIQNVCRGTKSGTGNAYGFHWSYL